SASIFIILFLVSYASNIFWGGLIKIGLVDIPFYPFDFLLTIMVITLFLFSRHIKMVKVNEQQTLELKKAYKEKDQFLANTSHELRNPLHGLLNIAQTMLDDRDGSLTKENKENLKLLIDVGKRMRFTLNDLLDITRLQDKQIQLKKENINLHSTLSGVVDMIRFMADGKNLQFKIHIPVDFPYVNADKNRLIQILFNLLHNAVKYTQEGTITITATEKN